MNQRRQADSKSRSQTLQTKPKMLNLQSRTDFNKKKNHEIQTLVVRFHRCRTTQSGFSVSCPSPSIQKGTSVSCVTIFREEVREGKFRIATKSSTTMESNANAIPSRLTPTGANHAKRLKRKRPTEVSLFQNYVLRKPIVLVEQQQHQCQGGRTQQALQEAKSWH